MKSFLVLDIETVADSSITWDAAKKGFPPAPNHQVAALGVLWFDKHYKLHRLGAFGAQGDDPIDEQNVLQEFASFIGKETPDIVTYNGRSFDLPVLCNRMLRYGISFEAYYANRDYRYRYADGGHIDLCELLTDHGAAQRPPLASYAQLIGMPGKMDIDGSMIQGLYDRHKYREIREYCLHDVVQTAFLFLRVQLLRGRLSLEDYREKASALWNELAQDPRVAAVFENANRARTLLEAQVV